MIIIVHYIPAAPNPPTGLTVAQVSASSVMVSWTPPTDTTGVTGYQIYYTEKGGRKESNVMSGANTTMDTISDLTIGSTYSITIVSTSHGRPSDEIGPKEITLGMSCNLFQIFE